MDDWEQPLTDEEDAVRRYLTWIEDPGSLRDEGHIADLRSKIDAASDPIEKIHLASDLHRAMQVDGTELRDRFVAVAKRWAHANGIVPEAFLQLGVPADDLRQAGFDVSGSPRRRSDVGTVGPSSRRATRTSTEEIRAALSGREVA